MGLEYFIFYTEASVICILILALILINNKLNGTKQEKQLCFDRAIISFILYFSTDACWAGMLSHQIPRVRFFVVLVNFLNYVLLSLMTYEWFMFMAASENMAFRNSRGKRMLCLLPLGISLTVIILAYAADPHFWVSESGEVNALYQPLFLSAPIIYLLITAVCSMVNARKAETKAEKKQCRLIGIFPLGVAAFGMLQVLFVNAPTLCFGCTLMLLFFYLQSMQALISVDELTQLNNRGQINRYLEQVRYRENDKVFAIMLDIDRFKLINDTYGHAEGDRALTLTAEALKQGCDDLDAKVFLGRYGGDEFVVMLQSAENADVTPEQALETIRRELSETQQKNDLPYALDISAGFSRLRGKGDTLRACLIRADERLYETKRAKGTAR